MSFLFGNVRFLSFGLVLAVFSSFGQTYFFGVFREPVSAELGLSNSGFGLFYMLVTLGSAIGLNWFGNLIDTIPLRRYAPCLLLALGCACLFIGLSGPLVTVFIAMMLVRLLGQGLTVHAAMTSMSRYYDRDRGKAVAIAGLGMPIGQALFPPLAVYLLTQTDWRTSWLFFAALCILVGVPMVWWLLKGHDRRHSDWLQAQESKRNSLKDPQTSARRRDVLKDYRFYLLLPAVIVVPFWITAVFFFAQEIAETKGWTMQALTGLYWVYALGAVAVPLLAGSLVDHFGGTRLVPFYPPVMGIGLLCVLLGTDIVGISAFLVLMGVVLGLAGPINNAMWAELYGTRHLGEIKALVTSLVVLSTALAPYLLGLLLDAGVGFSAILVAGVVHSFASSLLAWPVTRRQ